MLKMLRMTGAVSVFILISCLFQACRGTEKIPPVTRELTLRDNSMMMIRIPPMKFPGGPLGTVLLQEEERKKVLEVGQAYWLAR